MTNQSDFTNLIKYLPLVLLLLFSYSLYGQNRSDSIMIKKSFGISFYRYSEKLTMKRLLEITSSNPAAYEEMKIAQTNNTLGAVFGFFGGLLIGWPIGTAIGGGEPNWGLALGGVGLTCIGIPFSVAYSKHARRAVEIYNSGLNTSQGKDIDFKFSLSFNGAAFKIIF